MKEKNPTVFGTKISKETDKFEDSKGIPKQSSNR